MECEREQLARELERMAGAVREGTVMALAVASAEVLGAPVRSRVFVAGGAPPKSGERLALALGEHVLEGAVELRGDVSA